MDNKKPIFELNKVQKTERLYIEKLSIPEKALTIISGDTGSGKSTLITILGLMNKYDNNVSSIRLRLNSQIKYDYSVLYNRKKKMEMVRQKHFGFVFQRDNLIDGMTCFENIVFPKLIRNSSKRYNRKELVNQINEWLEIFRFLDIKNDLDKFLKKSPANLSGGQRQRMALIRGIMHRPDILFADEPIASVDKNTAINIARALETYVKTTGKTVILVIHDKDINDFSLFPRYRIHVTGNRHVNAYWENGPSD